MNVLIADDEAPARARLAQMLAEVGEPYTLAGEASNGREVVQQCERLQIDLVLLDIRMPGMDGIEAATALAHTARPPAVIFVTAYEEHALAAFEANAIDYLLKPVRRERLLRALHKARAVTAEQMAALDGEQAYLSASYRGGLTRIPARDVILLRADSKYVEVWHRGGMTLTEESLRAIEDRLPGRFHRVHRSALVAPARIRGLHKTADGRLQLELDGCDVVVEVSRRHAPDVRRLLQGGAG